MVDGRIKAKKILASISLLPKIYSFKMKDSNKLSSRKDGNCMKLRNLMTKFVLLALFIGGVSSCGDNHSSSNGTIYDYDIQISVKSNSGKKLKNVNVGLYNENKLVSSEKTDEEGLCDFNVPKKSYEVKLTELPDGYYVDKEYFTNVDDSRFDIVLYSKIAEGDRPEDKGTYSIGDVMYDNTFTNTEGESLTFSSLLNSYKAIFINFFYINCTWCSREFPFLEEAYKDYEDKIAVLAISYQDTLEAMANYKKNNEYTFDMCYDENHEFTGQFPLTGFPTSVLIDRYGVVRVYHETAILAKNEFVDIFEKYTSDDYVPTEEKGNGNGETELVEPTYTMPSSKEIEKAANGEGFNATWYADQNPSTMKYSWPWLVSDDGKSIYPSNSKVSGSYASIYTTVNIAADEVLVFDYLPSCEAYGDYLYVYVDGTIEFTITGVDNNWSTAYAFATNWGGEHEIGFLYVKDDDGYSGEDRVYVNNIRILKESEITDSVYIRKHASFDYNETTMRYNQTVEVFLNENDGYYHVNNVDGPLLLVDMISPNSNHFSNLAVWELIAQGAFRLGLRDYSYIMEDYYLWAYNSEIGATPVTEELCEILKKFTAYYHLREFGDDENYTPYETQWLDLCCYYQGYNMNGVEMPDPIKGLATISCFEAQLGDQNFVEITHFTMPRGLLSRFVPEESGVYDISSVSNNKTVAWIFLNDDRNNSLYYESSQAERIFNITSEIDANYDKDYSLNYHMYVYLEKDVPYYICSGFDDMYETGTIQFKIQKLDDNFEYFTSCSYGAFTTENDDMTGDIIIGDGIDIALGSDGYYHQKYSDGSLGSIIYCDFIYPSYFTYSINDMIDDNFFNLAFDREEETAIEGGQDYTSLMKGYRSKIINSNDLTNGCVPVDAKLASALQALMDVYTFQGVENSWLKLCYYYKNVNLGKGE